MIRKLSALCWALFVVFSLLPSAAHCQDESPGLKSRLDAWAESQDWFFGASYSSVNYDEPAFEAFFGQAEQPLVRVGSGWYFLPNLAFCTRIGGMYQEGEALGALTGEPSGEDIVFFAAPFQADLRYRFKFLEEQWVVPSVWAGYDYWYFSEENDYLDDIDGDKTGWHWGADLAFLLDPLDKRAAHRMKRDFRVADTYLVGGYEEMEVGAGEDGIEFTGALWSVGVRFEVVGD